MSEGPRYRLKPPFPRTLSRRSLLRIGAGGAVALAGGAFLASRGLGSLSSDSDDDATTNSSSAFATATPRPAFSAARLITRNDCSGEVQTTRYASGQPIPGQAGFYVLDATSNSV